jgi:hypothetical protein
VAQFHLPGGQKMEVAGKYWMPSLTVIVLLFMGGWFAASLTEANDAGGAFVRTMTVRGKVVRVHGQPVRVVVPASTIVSQGAVVTVPGRTINLTRTDTRLASSPTLTLPGNTVVTTVTQPASTVISTVAAAASTVTVVETVTQPSTATSTATVVTTVTAPPTS